VKVVTAVLVPSMDVDTKVSTTGDVLPEEGKTAADVGQRADVEKIVEVTGSVKVVDGPTTVDKVVWVVTGKIQLIVPDWLKFMALKSPEPPVIIAFVHVGDN